MKNLANVLSFAAHLLGVIVAIVATGIFLLAAVVIVGFMLYVMLVVLGVTLFCMVALCWPFPVDIDAILQGYVDILNGVVQWISSLL